MPTAWPQAALQAQAVAARTYALSALKPEAIYDLKATVASQAYRGIASETDSTRQAVSSTRGQVLMQDGRLIQAVFHSSSGGVTEDSGQVWSRQLPYLVSVPDFDDGSPVSRWHLRFEPDQLRRQFRETDGVMRIDVLDTSQSGRVKRARVIGPAGSLELSGAELRQRLGLRSTLVTFQLQPVSEAFSTVPVSGPIDRAVRQTLAARQATATTGVGSTVVDSATGQVMTPAPQVGALAPPSPPPALDAGSRPGAASLPAFALLIDGRGFGHGVGMSQWGACAMARQGVPYERILRHYYRGAELVSYPGR
jgi:stage II sporulation protein D